MTVNDKIHDAAVVGSGPAGMTAAMQVRRMGLEVALFERNRPGGLLLHAGCVENYPGVEGALDGASLARRFADKLAFFGVVPIRQEVRAWSREGSLFVLETSGPSCRARTLVVATGTRPRAHGLRIESAEAAARVTDDVLAILPGRPSSAIIIGGGDAAFDYALTLSSKGWETAVVFRKDRPAALRLLVERVEAGRHIAVCPGVAAEAVSSVDTGGVALRGRRRGEPWERRADWVLTAVGREPEDSLLRPLRLPSGLTGEVDAEPGLFAAGDVRRSTSRQSVIAAGDGMTSAMAVAAFLAGR
jgi:thioredoxin reductase (NADPH)